jgi:hypothetical protein
MRRGTRGAGGLHLDRGDRAIVIFSLGVLMVLQITSALSRRTE